MQTPYPAESSKEQPSTTGDVIDAEALARLKALDRPGRPSVYAKVLSRYLPAAQESVESLREAVKTGDLDTLARVAHRLKSSSAQVGALALAASCQELERQGRSGTVEGAAVLCERLEAHYREVVRVLERELARQAEGSR